MKTCLFCEQSVMDTKDAVRKKFCGRECYRQSRLSRPLSNKSTGHYRARAIKQEHQCERCGSMRQIHVHHKDRNPLNAALGNLESLCSKCHHAEHLKILLSSCAVCGKAFRAASHRNRNKICSVWCAKEWGRISANKRWGRPALDDCAVTAMHSLPRRRKLSLNPI